MFRQPYLTDLLQFEEDGLTHSVRTPDDWRRKAQDIRCRILGVLGSGPERMPEADLQVHEEVREEGFLRRLVSYAVEDGERIKAYLLVPEAVDAPRPAVLCLHPTTREAKREPVGLGGEPGKAYALHLVRRGYVCLAPDHLAAGSRVEPGMNPYDTSVFYRRHPGWSAVGKGIGDAMRAVDVLTTLPEVDAERIGVMGHSLGGHSAVFAAAFDERLKACVSNCGMTTFADNPRRLEWSRDHWYIYLPKLRPLFLAGLNAPFDMHEMAALIAPRAFLNISSLTDASCPLSDRALQELVWRVREVYGLLDAKDRFAAFFHDFGHTYPDEARSLANAWLDRMLGPAPQRPVETSASQ